MKSSPFKPFILVGVCLLPILVIYLFSFFSVEAKIVTGLIALTLLLIIAGLLTQYTTEFILEKEKFTIIDKKQNKDYKKKDYSKKDVHSISVKAYMPLSKSSPRYLFLITIHTKSDTTKFVMNSYSEVNKMIREWNTFGYSNYELKAWEELRRFLWIRPVVYGLLIMSPVVLAVLWVKF